MSGFFAKKYGDKKVNRVTTEETLIIRNELFNILKHILEDTNVVDFYGNKNLLISNILTDKKDHGDIDSFIYIPDTIKPNILIQIIRETNQLIDVNRNDNVYSILFHSLIVNKNVQIDIHICHDKKHFETTYFNYYRVPYLFFLL